MEQEWLSVRSTLCGGMSATSELFNTSNTDEHLLLLTCSHTWLNHASFIISITPNTKHAHIHCMYRNRQDCVQCVVVSILRNKVGLALGKYDCFILRSGAQRWMSPTRYWSNKELRKALKISPSSLNHESKRVEDVLHLQLTFRQWGFGFVSFPWNENMRLLETVSRRRK